MGHEEHDHVHVSHAHHSHHSPHVQGAGRAFLIGILLNSAFVLIEWGFGVASHSLALIADAVHNLGDVLSLMLAWGAAVLARRLPSERYTFGLRASSILGALANAVLLLLVTGGLAWEAVERFNTPQATEGQTVVIVALCGVLINGLTAWLFMAGSRHDLNIRGAYLHMLADAAVSLGVVIAGVAVMFTGWQWLDPFVTLLLVIVITWSTWALLRDAITLALQGVPPGISIPEVHTCLISLPEVSEAHDLHIWGMSTTENALTAHLVCPAGHPGDAFLQALSNDIGRRFGIHHVTVQIETGDAAVCPVRDACVLTSTLRHGH